MEPWAHQKKPLWRLYREATRYEYTDPDRAYEIFENVYEDLENYTGNPDDWHNTAMVAARVGHREAELRLIQCGLKEWPDNVDLLCDELQLRITTHRNPQRAREIVDQLEKMELSQKAPYWRYWVYMAIYYARFLHDPQRALDLLDQALYHVRRDSVMDILRNYRRVLVDSIPVRPIERNLEDLEKYHRWILETLEARYQMGLRLGLENGYVLAAELARLYQEQAGREVSSPSSTSEPGEPQEDYLEKALYYLELAEKLYTGDPNHPITEIYDQRMRILMAQHKYGEALQLIQSLRYTLRGRIRQDFSPAVMWERAARSTGQSLEELEAVLGIPARPARPEESSEVLTTAVNMLLANDGQLLEEIARQYPQLAKALQKMVHRLQGG